MEEKDDAIKDAFYANLEGHSTISPNGVRLIDFAAVRNLVVYSTMFQHLDIHKVTWLSPDRSTRNQIDQIVGRYVTNVLDVV